MASVRSPTIEDVMTPFEKYVDVDTVRVTMGPNPLNTFLRSRTTLTRVYHYTTKDNRDMFQTGRAGHDHLCQSCLAFNVQPFLTTSHHASGISIRHMQSAWNMFCPVIVRMAAQYTYAVEFVAAMNDTLYRLGKYSKSAGDIFKFLHEVYSANRAATLNCVAGVIFALLTNALVGRTPVNPTMTLGKSVMPVVAAETDQHVFIVVLRSIDVLQELRQFPSTCPSHSDIEAVYESTMGLPYTSYTWAHTHPNLDITKRVMHWVLDVQSAETTHFCATVSACHMTRGIASCHNAMMFPVSCNRTTDPLYHTQHLRSMHATNAPVSSIAKYMHMAIELMLPGMQLTYAHVVEYLCNTACNMPRSKDKRDVVRHMCSRLALMRSSSNDGWSNARIAAAVRKLRCFNVNAR